MIKAIVFVLVQVCAANEHYRAHIVPREPGQFKHFNPR